jgi:hypothetical protein
MWSFGRLSVLRREDDLEVVAGAELNRRRQRLVSSESKIVCQYRTAKKRYSPTSPSNRCPLHFPCPEH